MSAQVLPQGNLPDVISLVIRSFARMSAVFILATLAVGAVLVALDTVKGSASSQAIESLGDTLTPTHFVYLPFVFNERPCTDPPSGTVMIAGQATVHGKPAQSGVPFHLYWHPHWEYPGTLIETTTTGNEGRFCFGPVDVLPYCRGMWYAVSFWYVSGTMPEDDYASSWWKQVLACQSGKVYTVSAEIGR